jgi:hypothetical protein
MYFKGKFLIRVDGGVRSLVKTNRAGDQTIAELSSDFGGDMVIEALKGVIAKAGGTLTDETTGLVLAGDIGEMITSGNYAGACH